MYFFFYKYFDICGYLYQFNFQVLSTLKSLTPRVEYRDRLNRRERAEFVVHRAAGGSQLGLVIANAPLGGFGLDPAARDRTRI